ncbi:MAG: hypothetical protein AB3N17_19530 [Tateyamaria sp.]
MPIRTMLSIPGNTPAAEGRRFIVRALTIWIVLFVLVTTYILGNGILNGTVNPAYTWAGLPPLLLVLLAACALIWATVKGYILAGIVASILCLMHLYSLLGFFYGSPLKMIEDIINAILSIMVLRGTFLWIRHKDEEPSGA